MDMQLIKLESI